jgi:hypothetical protein
MKVSNICLVFDELIFKSLYSWFSSDSNVSPQIQIFLKILSGVNCIINVRSVIDNLVIYLDSFPGASDVQKNNTGSWRKKS